MISGRAEDHDRSTPYVEPNMRKGDLMTNAEAVGGDVTNPIAKELRKKGLKKNHILVKMAEAGQLIAMKCEMPQCYHHEGRGEFDPVGSEIKDWVPSPDHYPILKSKRGKLTADNVRLSHVRCNQLDFAWRQRTGNMLAAGSSLEEIAVSLNHESKGARPVHGTNEWTAASVRKAYVS